MNANRDQQTIEIVTRFFSVLDRLKQDGVIRGIQTFTTRYNIGRWNFITMRNNPEQCGAFRVHWLAVLVRDYKINPYYLLLGEGSVYIPGFTPEIVRKLQENCK